MKNPDNDRSDGGFAAGFSLGLIAGAMGTFLAGSPKGSAVRQKLSDEWEKAKAYLKEQGLLNPEQEKTFSELLQTVKTKVIEESGLQLEEPEQTKPEKKRAYTRKSKPTQFKGV